MFLTAAIVAGVVGAVFAQTRLVVGVAVTMMLILPGVMLFSGNPRLLSLWGLILFTPLEFSKFWLLHKHVGGEYALRLEVTDLFMAALIFYWISDLISKGRWEVQIPRAAYYWLLLIVMAIGTVAFGSWRTVAAFEVVRMTKILLLLLLLVNHIRRRAQLEHILAGLAVGVIFQSTYGLFQYFTGATLGLDRIGEAVLTDQKLGQGLATETHRRVGALMGHPNIFSCYLGAHLPLLISVVFSGIPGKVRTLCLVSVALGLPALLVTLSRNGWAAFGLGLVIVLFMNNRHTVLRQRFPLARVAFIVVIGMGVLASSKLIIDRFQLTEASALDARWALNGIAWRMIQDKPILGHGKNATAYQISNIDRYKPEGRYVGDEIYTSETAPPIHNIYLQQWAEQGTLGLLIMLTMMGSFIIVAIKNRHVKDDVLAAMNMGLMAGMIAVMFHGMWDWVFWINGIMRMYFVFGAAVVAIYYLRVRMEREERDRAVALS